MNWDEPAEPRWIGSYKILRTLGEGGMGVVYEAEQTSPVHRRVALKVIARGMDTREIVARFEAERQALAVMDHSNIAKVFDGGETEAGLPFFVMELVSGTPLTEYCDNNKLSTSERLRLHIQMCSAIQHAHQKGIIHRDLKPSNILVALENDQPVTKVIDFGIAKAIGHDLTEKTIVTEFGLPMGTPNYMSPEQVEMSGLDVDARADIYSLGVMLYELLVGALPLDLKGMNIGERFAAIREREPPTPSARLTTLPGDQQETVARYRHTDPGSLRKTLRGDLDWVIMKALEKDRTRRYQTASELGAELVRYLADEPVVVRAPTTRYRIEKFVRRNRTAVVTAAMVVVAILVGATAAGVGMVRAQRAEAQMENTLDVMVEDLAEEAQQNAVRRDVMDALVAITRESPELSARLGAELDRAFSGPRSWQAHQHIAAVYRQLEFHEDAADHLTAALEDMSPESSDRIVLLRQLGEVYNLLGNYSEAASTLGMVASLSAAISDGGHRSLPPSLLRELATAREGLGDTEEAQRLRDQATALDRERFEGATRSDR